MVNVRAMHQRDLPILQNHRAAQAGKGRGRSFCPAFHGRGSLDEII